MSLSFDLGSLPTRTTAMDCVVNALKEAGNSQEGVTVVVVEGESGVGKSHLLANIDCAVDIKASNTFYDESDLHSGFLHCVEDLAISSLDETLTSFDFHPWSDLLERFLPRLYDLVGSLPKGERHGEYTALETTQRLQALITELCDGIFTKKSAVLILDDLQWAASGATELLAALLRRHAASGTQWEGTTLAFSSRKERRAEIDQWLLSIGEVIPVYRTQLENLTVDEIEEAVVLTSSQEDKRELSQRAFKATGGNPLKLCRYAAQASRNWSLGDAVESDGVIAVQDASLELEQLGDNKLSKTLATCAAFVGRFSRLAVEKACGESVADVIDEAIHQGWLVEFYRGDLAFAHDQLRDAANERLSSSERTEVLLQIAKTKLQEKQPISAALYLQRLPWENTEFVHGSSQEFRDESLQAFLLGAEYANALSSPRQALQYAEFAEQLASTVRDDLDTQLRIAERRTSAYLALGDHVRIDAVAESLAGEAENVNRAAWARIISTCLVSHLSRGELHKCVDLAIDSVAKLGWHIPRRGVQDEAWQKVNQTLVLLEPSSEEGEAAKSPEAAQFLSLAIPAFHQSRPDLYPFAAATIVEASVGSPTADTLPFGVATLGIAHALLEQRKSGFLLGKQALRLAAESSSRTSARTTFAVAFLLDHIVESIGPEAVQRLDEAVDAAITVGDVDHACYAKHLSNVYRFYNSENLGELRDRLSSGSQLVSFFGQQHILAWNQVYQQLVENLHHAQTPSVLLHGSVFSEFMVDTPSPDLQYRIHLARLMLAVVFGQHSAAVREATILEGLAGAAKAQYEILPFRFLAALANYRACLTATDDAASLLTRADFHRDEFAEQTRYSDAFELEFRMLDAMRKLAGGARDESVEALWDVLDSASTNQRFLHGGIVAELLAELETDPQQQMRAQSICIDLYKAWGAETKVATLQKRSQSDDGAGGDTNLIRRLVSAGTPEESLVVLSGWLVRLTGQSNFAFHFRGTWAEIVSPNAYQVPLAIRRDAGVFEGVLDAFDVREFERYQADPQLSQAGVRSFLAVPLRQSSQTVGVIYSSGTEVRTPLTSNVKERLVAISELVVQLLDRKLLHRVMESRASADSLALSISNESVDGLQNEIRQLERTSWTSLVVGGLSHELSTPLASARVVAGTLQATLAEATNSDQVQLERCREALPLLLQSLEAMADRINNASRRIGGSLADRSTFSLRAVAEQVVSDLLRTLATDDSNTRIGIFVARDIEIDGFETLTRQLLENLVRNAIVHGSSTADGDGEVGIQATTRDGWVELSVQDNGTADTSIEQFFISDRTEQSKTPGLGLGLSIARSIVCGPLGGKIAARRPKAGGTKVIVEFPLVAPETHRPKPARD